MVPHSPSAEEAVLAFMSERGDALARGVDCLNEAAFTSEDHRALFRGGKGDPAAQAGRGDHGD